MAEHRSRVLGMSLEDILRFRTRKPFNLPTDPDSYPRFLSFELRHDYLIRDLLRSFLKILNRQQRDENDESDSSDEDEVDKILAEFGSSDEEDEEGYSEGEAEHERRQIMATIKPALKFRDLGMYGGRRGRGGHGLHGGRGRGEQTTRTGRVHEAEHMDIPAKYSDLGKKRELRLTNLHYPPEDTASTSNPERAKRRRVRDPDTPKSNARNTGIIANASSLLANSIEPISAPGEGLVWPKFERPIALNAPVDENLRTERKGTTSGKKPKAEPGSWDDVYRKLPALSGGDVRSPGPRDFRVKQEHVKQMILDSLPYRRRTRVAKFVPDADVAFVGEQFPRQKFLPWRGDLIIIPRPGRPQPSYLESYMGEGAIEDRKFTNGELVLRIGHFNTFPSILVPRDFEYEPYSWVSLFAFNPMDTNHATEWKFLGHQTELDDAQISYPPYESQGKFLKVGDQVLDYTQFEPIVPRRGDVIIKREAWDPNYHHNVNFWYSMVKWHRDTQFPFVAGDLLVRRFIDNQYNDNKTSNIPRNPLLWGWAEMYEYHDFHNSGHSWIFWGRTQHWYDKPTANQEHEVIKYTCDQGIDDEDDLEHEMVNPRRYVVGEKKENKNVEQQPKQETSLSAKDSALRLN